MTARRLHRVPRRDVEQLADDVVDWVAYTLVMRRLVEDSSDGERGRGELLCHAPEALR